MTSARLEVGQLARPRRREHVEEFSGDRLLVARHFSK